MKTITVLGATGSVGDSTAALLSAHPDLFRIEALVSNNNVAALAKRSIDLKAKRAVAADASCYTALKEALSGTGIACAAGESAVLEAASLPVDVCIAGIVGAAGLAPTMTALKAAKVLALANKEALVCAGNLLLEQARQAGCTLMPVDSEHNAVFQVFEARQRGAIRHITLTASGGPFRTYSEEQLAAVTPAQAVKHPVWSMGQKISVDSATMMNKGLEIIEACHLFGLPEDRVRALVHPQSIVHGMVAYEDGSTLAHLSKPDMMTPLSYAMGWPDRLSVPLPMLDDHDLCRLTFEPVDSRRFPAVELARAAFRQGGSAPAMLNAANEIAVEAFLKQQLPFTAISNVVDRVLQQLPVERVVTLDDVTGADAAGRRAAKDLCHQYAA